jgi:subtilase family serine protease
MRPPLGRRVIARRSFVAIGAAVLIVPLIAGNAFAGSSSERWKIAGSRPAWASTAPVVGTPAASTKIAFNVVLPLRNAADAAALATEVSDPASPDYGHYVSAAQFNARFGPTASQVSKVRTFLADSGLQVTGVAAGNRWISASGTAHQVESAFGTKLRNYRFKGHTIREPASTLTVPHSMTGLITGIVGIGTEDVLRRPASLTGTGTPKPAAVKPDATTTCSSYWNQHQVTGPKAYSKTSFPTVGCGYTPAELRTAYGVQPSVTAGDTGKGISVAIIDAYGSPTMLADANSLATSEGEPKFAAGQYNEHFMGTFINEPTECGAEVDWNEEEALDVEAVHGIAPGATVNYVGATDCDTGLDDAMNYVVSNQTATIVSDSWGTEGEDGIADEVAIEDSIFIQAATEGIGFYFSSGDSGDEIIDGAPHPEPDYPASDPNVTGVGGTSLAVTSKNAYDFETQWGNYIDPVVSKKYVEALPGEFDGGAGGGVSRLFNEPSYQTSVVPSTLAKKNGSAAMRVVPDIAAVADPETGFDIKFSGYPNDHVIGGTSLACPVIAGIQALVSQGRVVPIGFANPELYSLATTAFHDVKAPSSTTTMMTPDGAYLFTMAEDTSLTATSGYDDSTGRGTPSGLNFLLGERLLSSQPVTGVVHTP